MGDVPTIRVKRGEDIVVINESDYDETKHVIIDANDEPAAPQKRKDKKR